MTKEEQLISIKCIWNLLKKFLPEEYNCQTDMYWGCFEIYCGPAVIAYLWCGHKTPAYFSYSIYYLSDPEFNIEDLVCDIITCAETDEPDNLKPDLLLIL